MNFTLCMLLRVVLPLMAALHGSSAAFHGSLLKHKEQKEQETHISQGWPSIKVLPSFSVTAAVSPFPDLETPLTTYEAPEVSGLP